MSDATTLFQPLTLRGLTLPNRIAMCPMSRYASPGGVPGADVAAYYARRAAGEVGLIFTEGSAIDHPAACDNPAIPHLHGEEAMRGWEGVVAAVHAAGGRIMPQLWHQGVLFDPRIASDPSIVPLRPSGLWGPLGNSSLAADYLASIPPVTRPMTDNEISDVVAAYARTAAAAAAVGFDGIAIHGGHGYLIDSFLWSGTNHRDDRWGGSPTARAAFAVAVVRAIRDEVPEGYPIVFRFSQHKAQDYDACIADTPAELGALLGPIADAGVDLFDASTRCVGQPAFSGSPLNLAGWAKQVTGKPSIAVGGIGLDNPLHEMFRTGRSATEDNFAPLIERLEAGEFDMIGVGRSLLSDPGFVRRLLSGEPLLPFDTAALGELR